MEGGVEDRTPVTLAAEHEGDAPDEGLDDFASLAESYLLADPSLAHEFAEVHEDDFGNALAKVPGDLEAKKAEDLDTFLWDPTAAELRAGELHDWERNAARHPHGKTRAETKDSSEWEHTREHRGSLLNTHKSESPNSGILSATSTPLQAVRQSAQNMRVEIPEDSGKRPESPFTARMHRQDPAHMVFDDGKHPVPQSFSRLLHARSEGLEPMDGYDWPLGGYPGYSHPQHQRPMFANQMPQSQMRGGRMAWGSGDFQEMASWNRMRETRNGLPPYRNPEIPLEDILEHTIPDRSQSQGDLLEHTPMQHHLRSRAASSVEDVCNAPGPKGMMPSISQPLFSPQHPATPSEAFSAERKRKRPVDVMFSPNPVAVGHQDAVPHTSLGVRAAPASFISSSSSPIAHEELIRTLKAQIDGIDAQTKSILKDTLYRISRHTNVANGGMENNRSRQSSRSQYLDRLVANFLYNRFEFPDARQEGGPYPGSSGGYGGRGYRTSSIESIKPLLP